jgi:hypothetical protein
MLRMTYHQGEPCLLCLPNQLTPDLDSLYSTFLSLIANSDMRPEFKGYPTLVETRAFLQGLAPGIDWGPLVEPLNRLASQAARANDSGFVGNFHDG